MMRPRPALLLIAALALALLPAPAAAADTPPSQPGKVRRGSGRFAFEESVLANGLRVLSLEDTSTPIVAVQLWYHVGSKDEQVDRQGFAHMFEHMMFRGTDRLGPKDHFEFIRSTGGDCNAYTAFDQTVYVQELPKNQLEMVLWLEAERMAHLRIDEGGFATERKVVEEERRLGLNQPYGRLPEQVLAAVFDGHPYRWSPIGQIEHLRASTAQDIQHFWDTYYVPNNATLVVVGDVSHGEVRNLAQKHFGWIPRCPDPPRVPPRGTLPGALRRLDVHEENGPVPLAGIVFETVPKGHPDALPLEMLVSVLGGGESSRLYLDLVRRKQVAAFGGGGAVGFEQAGLAILGGVAKPFGDVDAIVAATWDAIAAVREDGVTEDELAKVAANLHRDDVTESLSVASKASALGEAAVLLGDAQLVNTRAERVRAVTVDDLRRVANAYLVPERATEVRVKPSLGGMLGSVFSLAAMTGDMPEEAAAEDEADEEVEGGARATASGPKAEAKRPEGHPERPPVAPPLDVAIDLAAHHEHLENGLRLVVVENHEVPFVSLSLRLEAGAFTEDPEYPGTAAMAASMVTRGTFANDAEALAAELERHAISLSAEAGHDSAQVSVSCVTAQLDRAARLLAEVVLVPRFADREFATLRDQTATGMAVSEKTPSVIADRALDRALWGEEHPYGRPAEGTSADLPKLTPARLRDWWTANVRPDTATLYVAGDVTPEQARSLAERVFGDWEAEGEPFAPPLPPSHQPSSVVIKLIDRPGAVQSEIRAGHEGITRRNPLFAGGVVLTQVLGGSFTSRLNDVLRVQKGLTYGASGGLSSRRFGGQLAVRTFTKTPRTAETVKAVVDEVARMAAVPPTDDELRSAVSYLAGAFAGSLETPQAVAARLWTLQLEDLPPDWWNGYLERIAATTSEGVAEAAQALLHPDRLVIVVVGDASQVQESLAEIAPVELVVEG